jgi:DNA-binding Xre family transcriptional regulator
VGLSHALQDALRTRGLRVGDLLTRTAQRDRSTIYRVLKGDTRDTKVSTLLALCAALGVTPNDLLGAAGLWADDARSPDPLDQRLRHSFGLVQTLAAPLKLVAVTQIERIVETWREAMVGSLDGERV